MKKLRILGSALACLGIMLLYLAAGQEPVGVPASAPTEASGDQVGNGSARQESSRVSSTAAVNPPAKTATVLSDDTPRPYFKRSGNTVVASDGTRHPLRIYHAQSMPDDPSANQPWVSLAGIDDAWDTPRGGGSTLLAVIDTGFALQHEEFQGRWYTNTGEIASNGIDDDGNGLVDDTRGWDFANWDKDVQAQAEGRHGTFVTGVAAATGDNGKGIAGVDWGTTILPIQALGEDGEGYSSDVANGIIYATDQGADVISLSLGSDEPDSAVRQAVDYAISEGAVVVAAAGNDGCDCMVYPANYPETLSVGATNNSNQRASFSSYGANLDVMAPGVNLYTTDWQTSNPTSAYAGNISGTSLATPVVSGLLTRLKSLQPTATPLQLIAALTRTTDRLTLGSSTARSDTLGFGLVDGGAASDRLSTPYSPSQIYTFSPVSLGQDISPGSPAEKSEGSATVYRCDDSRPGTTPLYDLNVNVQDFFTVSQAEVHQAAGQSYSGGVFGYACLTMPHDTPGATAPEISLHKVWDLTGSH